MQKETGLIDWAHRPAVRAADTSIVCPYSNAPRGNIDVPLVRERDQTCDAHHTFCGRLGLFAQRNISCALASPYPKTHSRVHSHFV